MGKTVAIALLAACLVCGAIADCNNNLLYDTDLFGSDIRGIPNGPSLWAFDAADCCQLCIDTLDCVAFTYSKATGACWLKQPGFAPPSKKSGLISKQVIPNKCFSGYDGSYEVFGREIPFSAGFYTPRDDICCLECAETKGCVAMTFYEDIRQCYLFSDVDGGVNAINAVSKIFD